MRNIIFSGIIMSLLTIQCLAQDNTFPVSGNVGIGSFKLEEKLTIGEFGGSIALKDITTAVSGRSSLGRLKFYDYGGEAAYIALEHNYYIGTTPRAMLFSVDGSERLRINSSGNVGIGTNNPDQKLTIKGGIGFDYNSADKKLYSPEDGVLEWMTHKYAGDHGFVVSHQGDRRVFLNIDGNSYLTGGNLGIGTTTPTEKLSVNGKIRAQEIKIEATNWPDYVFGEDYETRSLGELEGFIKTNKHLPDMPSAQEVEKNGVELGEMNKLLLKKVEELTLYLIEKDKRIKNLESQNQSTDQKMNDLLNRMKVLEAKR